MDAASPQIYEFGAFRLDLTERLLTQKGKPIPLTPKAFEVLAYLVERPGHLVGKNELMNEVWSDSIVEEANLSRTIWMLRQALGDDRNGHGIIETVPKHGYRFVAEVRAVDSVAESGNRKPDDLETVVHPSKSVAVGSELPEHELADRAKSSIWRRYRGLSVAVLLSPILVAALISIYFTRISGDIAAPRKPIRSIAVLSLENLSGDKEQEYFSDSMTEILVTELARMGELNVIDRSATKRYNGTDKSISEIARELNVDAVATGSATQSSGRALITLRLYSADSGESIWSESFEREAGDMLALQASIARAIADEIKIKLTSQEQKALADDEPIIPEAEDAYLRGMYFFNKGVYGIQTAERKASMAKSFSLFARAIEIEPNWAKGHAALARAYANFANYSDESEYWEKAKVAAAKTLQLDDSNPVAHFVLANVLWRYEWDHAGAEREYKRAAELSSESGDLEIANYALFLSGAGRQKEAIVYMKRAERRDPFHIPMKMNMGNMYLRAGQLDQAIDQLQKVAELSPDHFNTRIALAVALACKGDFPKAISETRKVVDLSRDPKLAVNLAWVYAKAGQRAQALKVLAEAGKNVGSDDKSRFKFDSAGVYAELGDADKAFSTLEEVLAQHQKYVIWLKVERQLDKLRGDPRFADLLKRAGFTP